MASLHEKFVELGSSIPRFVRWYRSINNPACDPDFVDELIRMAGLAWLAADFSAACGKAATEEFVLRLKREDMAIRWAADQPLETA